MEVSNLKSFLANIGMTIRELSEYLDCNEAYLSLIANGKKKPGRRLAKDILEATDGLIDLKTKEKDKN